MSTFLIYSLFLAEIFVEFIPATYCFVVLVVLLPLCIILTLQLIKIINIDYQFSRLNNKNVLSCLDANDTLILASIYMKKRLWFSSVKILEKQCCQSLDLNYKYLNLIGSSYYGMKEYEIAKKFYLKAIECKKDYLVALQNLAKVSELTHDLSRALYAYNSILKHDPLNILAMNALKKLQSG